MTWPFCPYPSLVLISWLRMTSLMETSSQSQMKFYVTCEVVVRLKVTQSNMEEDLISLRISHKGQAILQDMEATSTVADLKDALCVQTLIPPERQKLLAKGILKDEMLASEIPRQMILVGSTDRVVENVQAQKSQVRVRPRPVKASTRRVPRSQYTIGKITTLLHLHNIPRAKSFLEMLSNDPGIQHIMDKYKLGVGELTELEPAGNTSRESKLLGLNENGGQKILLRLRTDDYEGFRDYNTVRRTLCHELAHNRHGEHNSEFWAFYRVLDRECVQYSGGTKLGEEYVPPNEHDDGHVDQGAFIGGTFVLGGRQEELTAREAILKAAEQRRQT